MIFSAAKKIAECWISVATDGQAVLDREKVVALPYGWVFFYNAPEFIADRTKIEFSLLGNVPILIERVNGELRVLGPRHEERLRELELELPEARLRMMPELPSW
ncbi:hypothetical protein GTP46_18725 [Duganella sp. FT135W]|uniref:Immunity protein 35 domain-containing protein n=1 Tax=Duganella flavida TaxID=2692175 RepID=A0A6L8KCB6_9BURK|nr:YrhB domain-containing protein [Duganella flavida]MYM24675.1 hypothetical protein [Duganella flavida]